MRVTFRARAPVASWSLVSELWLAALVQSDGPTLMKAPFREV